MANSSKAVVIYSAKTRKKLCEIKAPQRWHWPIPLFPLPIAISARDVWKNPEAVKRWAWTQAKVIDNQKNSLANMLFHKAKEGGGKASFIFKPSDLFYYPCITCGQKTVTSVYARWFLIIRGRVQGYACTNNKCPMKMVVIPQALIKHIDEIPTEYLAGVEGAT